MHRDRLTSKTRGLVISAIGNSAKVYHNDQMQTLSIPGKWRLTMSGAKPLAPGDIVEIDTQNSEWLIQNRVERKNHFTRKFPGPKPLPQTIAANIDFIFIIASCNQPRTPLGLIDRLLLTALTGGVSSYLIVNKVDIREKNDRDWNYIYNKAAEGVIFTSGITGEGVDELKEVIYGKTVLLAGSSGVGKSTLINNVDSSLNIKTGAVSESTGKGRHITSLAVLHQMQNDGWLIDTPGLRECALWKVSRQDIAQLYPEVRDHYEGCRFRDCLHVSEIGCAVKSYVGTEHFPEERYQGYCKLIEQSEDRV